MPTTIDWDAIWRSLDWTGDTLQDSVQNRLRQRARQYAQPLRQTETSGEALPVLAFRLGEERYGVNVTYVRAVRPLPRLTRVPGVPAYYRGVVNLRGKIITVLDLRLFLDVPASDLHAPDELLVTQCAGLELALLAHHVEGVLAVPRHALELTGDLRYALGVTAERLVLLDAEQIFTSERLIVGGTEE